jgi:ABC-type lipoprotein export system ATPase subunit
LDAVNEKQVMNIFKELAEKDKKCVIIVTHSQNVSQNVDVVYDLEENLKKIQERKLKIKQEEIGKN